MENPPSKARDIAIASLPLLYALGVLSWAIHGALHHLPWLPATFAQFFASGLTLAILCATAVAADHFLISTVDRVMARQTASWSNQTVRLLLGAASKGLAVLAVYFLLVLLLPSVPLLLLNSGQLGATFALLAIAVVGLQLLVAACMLLPFILAPLMTRINRLGRNHQDITDVVGNPLQEFPVHLGPMGDTTAPAKAWGAAVLAVAFLAVFSTVLLPALQPGFGGVPNGMATLDVDSAQLNPATQQALWPGSEVYGVASTPIVQVRFANAEVVILETSNQVLELRHDVVRAIHWQ